MTSAFWKISAFACSHYKREHFNNPSSVYDPCIVGAKQNALKKSAFSTEDALVWVVSNITGTFIDDGKARGKDWVLLPVPILPLCYWSTGFFICAHRCQTVVNTIAFSFLYYIHFEITGDPFNLIGSQKCDLFTNRIIFCSKLHHFSSIVISFSNTKWDVKAFLFPLFKKWATRSIKFWYWLNSAISKWL